MTDLRDILMEAERLAPDADEVLAGARARFGRRAWRRRAAGAAIASSVTLALLVAAVSVLAGTPAPQPQWRDAEIPPGTWERTLVLGWLPPGLDSPLIRVTVTYEEVLHPVSGGHYLLARLDRRHRGPTVDPPNWRRTQINGRHAREVSDQTLAKIEFQLPSERWVHLEFGGQNRQQYLKDTVRRIAESTTDTGHERLRTKLALTYLPAGQHVVGLTQNRLGIGGIITGTPAMKGLGFTIGLEPPVPDGLPDAEPLADIHGRTAVAFNQGQAVLVRAFHAGDLVVQATMNGGGVSPWPGPPPLPELVRIAQGVRWKG